MLALGLNTRHLLLFTLILLLGWMVSSAHATQIERWQTPKGAQVWFITAPELPMVDVRVVFDAGSARDGKQLGLASMTNTLIGMGDKIENEESFASKMEGLGAQFSTSALKDMAVMNLRSLTAPHLLEPALTLSANALASPSFDAKVMARVQAQKLVELKAKQQSPASLATEAFWQTLYGTHPYAHPADGTAEVITGLSPKDLTAFHQEYYVANNAVIAIVGALSRQQAEKIAIALTDGLPAGSKPKPLPQVSKEATAGYRAIEFPSQQAQIMVGQLGIDRLNTDYPALYVINHILGGSGFASRLMEEVREKRGLVYGVSSSLLPMRVQGPWIISLKTANANTKLALQVVEETTKGLLTDIPQSELDDHKANILGGFALQIDSNKDKVGYLAMMAFYGLSANWLTEFPEQVKALTRDDLLKAAQTYLQPSQWTGVLLGKQSEQNQDAPAQILPKTGSTGHH